MKIDEKRMKTRGTHGGERIVAVTPEKILFSGMTKRQKKGQMFILVTFVQRYLWLKTAINGHVTSPNHCWYDSVKPVTSSERK